MASVDATNWQFGQLNDDSVRIVGEVQKENYEQFLREYTHQLKDIGDALDDGRTENWDMTLDPVSLQCTPREQSSLLELIRTDNKVFNKVLIALGFLCEECNLLKDEANNRFIPALLYYGEGASDLEDSDGEVQVLMGRIISTLQDLYSFVLRCYDVIRNTIQQLSSLHSGKKGGASELDVSGVHFLPVYEHLASLMFVLIALDEVINKQPFLKDHWVLYKRMLKSVGHNPDKFGFTVKEIKTFEKLISSLEMFVLSGNIFANGVANQFDEPRSGIYVSNNTTFADEFVKCIKIIYNGTEPYIGDASETDQRFKLVGITGLYVLCTKIYFASQSKDKKLFKIFWDSYKRIPGVHLVGNIMWFASDFLQSHLSELVDTLDKKAKITVRSNRVQWLQLKEANLERDVQSLRVRIDNWMVEMETNFTYTGTALLATIDKQCTLFRQGLLLARNIHNTLTTIMDLHVYTEVPMTKSAVLLLCKLTELIKAIEGTFFRHAMLIAGATNHILQRLSFLAISVVQTARKRIVSDKRYSDRRLDILSAIVLAETALNGPASSERILSIKLAICLATRQRWFQDDELTLLSAHLKRMSDISDMHNILREACDTSFLYWQRVIFPTYLTNLYERTDSVSRIKYMFAAFQDCVIPLKATRHMETCDILVKKFTDEMIGRFKEVIVTRLCNDIETELRYDIHQNEYKLDDRNPFTVGVKNYSPFLKLPSIRFCGTFLHIKSEVEKYLDSTFYNLTTVALHDWRKYSDMKNMANVKYGLTLTETHLPSQTLEQGLDVLEIMRNIQTFVSKYNYNLNNQIFVENRSNNKHLNTINIRHIANSIRTHGTGIMNTTVNFTYQFLKRKFFIFSQFLYDEQIKSKLIKDRKFFKENHADTDQKYPYHRAVRFNTNIRKLGQHNDQTYLDNFRQLITEIGNSMGYIRMIRSGGLHCCSNAVRFIPDLDDVPSFTESCEEAELSSESTAASRTLDKVVENMVKNFSEGTEYFKMLVNVFAPEFRDQKHIHLKNFFMIIPPLTVNYVEHSISSKEKMNKKDKQGAAFTDDGFSMGIAYILKLLDQYNEFDSLHWSAAVLDRYKQEREKAVNAMKTAKENNDEALIQTNALTLNRLDNYQREYNLLFYSLSSARIFFRADQSAQEEQQAEAQATKQESTSANLASATNGTEGANVNSGPPPVETGSAPPPPGPPPPPPPPPPPAP